MENAQHFFDFAAEVGLTKHLGNIEATNRLIELCEIKSGDYVLDVGCGAGATPIYLAQNCACRVSGVDILPRMVERARELAERNGLSHQVELRVADAQDLPFPDNHFDVVISESVTAFPEDKLKAVNEYFRVLKPGGFVGLNESTWLKTPIPVEIINWASRQVGASVTPLLREEWTGLLDQARFTDLFVEIEEIDLKDEAAGIMKRYGFLRMMQIMGRTFKLYRKSPVYREFLKNIKQEGVTPDNLSEYFGYGIYVGRKPNRND